VRGERGHVGLEARDVLGVHAFAERPQRIVRLELVNLTRRR
jgi:hypothetical protein